MSFLWYRWSAIAASLPGRTDNEIKNYWNTHLKKRLLHRGIDPVTHRPITDLSLLSNLRSFLAASNLGTLQPNSWGIDNALRIQADAAQAARFQILHSLIQALVPNIAPNVDLVQLMTSAMVNQSGRLFTGILGGDSQVNSTPASISIPQEAPPETNSSIPGSSSKATFGAKNNCSFSASQMSSSGASPSADGLSLDLLQEMINSEDAFSSSSSELWDVDYYLRDVLA